jgi:hypothetical protein
MPAVDDRPDTMRQAWARSRWPLHIAVVSALSALAVALFWQIAQIPAFNKDNAFSLSFGPSVGPRHSLLSLVTEQYARLPAYRPVPVFTLWLQYELAGLNPESYFWVNIMLVVCMCVVLYALVYRMTGSWAAGGGSAFALLVDPKGFSAINTIVERQTTLACILGLLALLAALTSPPKARSGPIGVAIFVLLLLAALSKEYGLAFSAAVLVAALLNCSARSRPIVIATLGVVLAYAVLRWGVVGGTTGDYCEDMGYFDEVRRVCFGHTRGAGAVLLTGGAEVAQHGYNIGAAFVGTLLPFLFTGKGSLGGGVSIPLAVWSVLVTGLAMVAWVRAPRSALPFLALIIANSLLSLALYRERNVVIAVAALYAAAALGAVEAAGWLRSRNVRVEQLGVAAGALGLALWVGYQSLGRASDVRDLQQQRENTLARIVKHEQKKREITVDPCRYLDPSYAFEHPGTVPIVPTVVRNLKVRYHLPDPSCVSQR